MDIQDAFDTVMRNRLILRLHQQGWPEHLAMWAGSFMKDRSARARYQDITTPSSPLQCGLPQGSPASPVLFLLYQSLYTSYEIKAVDSAMRMTLPSYAPMRRTLDRKKSSAASACVEEMLLWGTDNGVSFDPDKTEVMHFSKRRLTAPPPVQHGNAEKYPDVVMRWLGIWLDRNLSFKP
ncbi:reverse transcriptase [Akanthomyces lecanii RCEF 1005]|uniref:Reverse transcriptase n=1 Tax=Akanthomyces lecanii RCEF 1005 TaxID=1081108 RepID=A0A167TI11_CORDF|nr:reverse transcriptase [Akanthomyces lecanii RCEF 1005]